MLYCGEASLQGSQHFHPTPNQQVAIATSALKELCAHNPNTAHLQKLAKLDPALPDLAPEDGTDPIPALEAHLNSLFAQHAETPPELDSPPVYRKDFLKEAKLFLPSKRNQLLGLLDEQGATTSDPKEMAQILNKFWTKTWETRASKASPARYLRKYTRRFPDHSLALPTEIQLADTIKSSGNSAPGVDGIPFSLYRELVATACPLLHQVMLALCSGKPPPKGFNLSLGVFLPKALDNKVESTRPIAMTNTDNRILAKAVASFILPHLGDTLSRYQSAIIPGRDIIDNIQEVASNFYSRNRNLPSSCPILLRRLTPSTTLSSLRSSSTCASPVSLLTLSEASLPTSASPLQSLRTDLLSSQLGKVFKQGCPLSPLLFIIAIDPLLFFLEQKRIVTRCFFDDVAILASETQSIEAGLQLLQEFGDASGLSLNPRKTVLLTSLKPCHEFRLWAARVRLTLPGSHPDSLPLVNSAKYLGTLIGRGVTTELIFKEALGKTLERIHSYHPFRDLLSVSQRVVVANTFILSIYGYLGRLYVIPQNVLKATSSALAKFIIPANFFKLTLLHRPTARLGLKTPLVHLKLRNLALILSRFEFPDPDCPGHTHPLHPNQQRLIATQLAQQLQPLYKGLPLQQDRHSSATLYSSLLHSRIFEEEQDQELARKIGLLFPGQHALTPTFVSNLLNNAKLIPPNTPTSIRFHLLRLLYNAAPDPQMERTWM